MSAIAETTVLHVHADTFRNVLLGLAGATALVSVAGALAFWLPGPANEAPTAGIETPALVELKPQPFAYRPAGDFSQAGRPTNAALRTVSLDRPLAIMMHQVTVGEYQRCVADGACPRVAVDQRAPADQPMVGVSWRDANAYAAWLSAKLGTTWRLPTDEEWAFAAGSRWHDDVQPEGGVDPAQRWLAQYTQESEREDVAQRAPLPVGSFGVNEKGVLDIAGNVWEWTDSCFVRRDLAAADGTQTVNCGVRVVQGSHRTYVSDFVRDARAGGCAVGKPPSNLGFRLVRETPAWKRWPTMMARLFKGTVG